MGFEGAKTKVWDYIIHAKFFGGDPTKEAVYGGMYGVSMLWNGVVSQETFEQPWFSPLLFKCILLQNVYFFFIRQNCLPQCLQNLFSTFSSKTIRVTQSSRNKTVEILLVQFIAGICLIPGMHF